MINDATMTSQALMRNAWMAHTAIPAFNIPYLPMMEPVVSALRDTGCFGLIAVARLEWEKFSSGSLAAFAEEYQRVRDERYTRLHLDHVPVIDEDYQAVPYLNIIQRATDLGFSSVMVDGSRLPLLENIAATQAVVVVSHAAGIPVEAELGAVLGHESGPLPPYDELFASGNGFTDPGDAHRFVQETGVDWLSVAIGNIHGAISGAAKAAKKPEARLNIDHLRRIVQETDIPLVLHGGSGIRKHCVLDGIRNGISKINVGTTLRQAYERSRTVSIATAQQAVYRTAVQLICEELELAGSAASITMQNQQEVA